MSEQAEKEKAPEVYAPFPVPQSEVPMRWVTDKDTPAPYLIESHDFNSSKHTAITYKKAKA